ncbi:LOW QUALITY PROTEIN: NACHT, LRR and PYD domains-containing protein 13 [Tupaia chinensis]|uniref:LOW QUALITY PROTEIN: NACHT, LRR and PYD domains-containing protein 13 n=1 Tax=Tupaia chinensis TaxID=246437 RepID=UPI000FFC117E|nr:LOW QUALITY PROTEIN: NACHT, LRR and PYD domains-containing protein 13 [Tupaia chinensis]
MSLSLTASVKTLPRDGLLSHLVALDQHQLEEFKLGLQSQQLLLENSRPLPWADVKAADPLNLYLLLGEHFSERQAWEVALSIFKSMNLTSLWEKVRAEMAGTVQAQGPQDPKQGDPEVSEEAAEHRYRHRERMKAKILAMWDNTSWPEDHIYVRNMTEQEHEELQNLLDPNRTGTQAQTIVLEGRAGVGKTTLAVKAMLHWACGLLFEHKFSYVFYLSCHAMRGVTETSFAELLSWDWPNSQAPIEEFMSRPERLLFIVDGFEEMSIPEASDSPPCTDWYQKLPVNKILFSLLKKHLVPFATLLITTRILSTNHLKGLLVNPCCVQIVGFTDKDQEEYFIRYFSDQKEARKILHWIRKNETLFNSWCPPMMCWAEPMMCWAVCSSLKQQKARRDLQLVARTTTSLYACFVSSLFSVAEVSWADRSWPRQWRALCALAAEGMWNAAFTFGKEDSRYRCLEAPFLDSLFKFSILQKVSDCEDCVTFTHASFQEFFAAMFYVLEGTEGSLGHSTKYQEMKTVLSSVLVNRSIYWTPMVRLLFGLLNQDLARKLEGTLHCKVSLQIMEDLLEWEEELHEPEMVSVPFDVLQFFHCLHETQEEDFVKMMLGHIFEADLDLSGNMELRVSAFCLKHCGRLNKLRLSVSGPIFQRVSDVETAEAGRIDSMHQWEELCSAFGANRSVSELDLSNSKLNPASMRSLCHALRSPRCRLQKLTCKSVTPVTVLKELVLVLHGNRRLTHLNVSSNELGLAVSTSIFRTLRHSACNLKYLCLEKCELVAASCQDLASLLVSTQRMTRLCLGFNRLRDDGVELLGAALAQPECTLQTLVLWFCQLGAPSCRHLSDALLRNRSLTQLNLSRNSLGDGGVALLCEALSRPDCSVQNLNLSDCAITRQGCQELANALKHNHNVQVLDLGNNDLQDEGVKPLCEALRRPGCTLTTLGLEKCSLTPACCQPLSSVLSSSQSLVSLNLLGNDLEVDGVKVLCFKKTCTV